MINIAEYKGNNNLIGKQFGRLTVIDYVGDSKWKCQCECGNITITKTSKLNNGSTKSCGCLRGESCKGNTRNRKPKKDLTNQKFGMLTPLYYVKGGKWHCKCDCGNEHDVDTKFLNNGHTKSCGCMKSNNERIITEILLENNIEFITQYTFSDLRGLNYGLLKFDFAIFKNKELSHLIEYNGEQHYRRVTSGWGNDFESIVINDNIKQQYCIDHNIELRIIKYDQEYSLEDLI